MGSLSLEDVSDVLHQSSRTDLPSLADILKPQQPVFVSVISAADGDKKMVLSSRLSLLHRGLALKHLYAGQVLPACVLSKEDHGFVNYFNVLLLKYFIRSFL